MNSTVLLAAAIGTVSSLFIAGRIIGSLGARRATTLAGLAMSLLLGLALELPGVPVLLAAMLVFGASMALFDVSINTEGSVLESLSGRARIPSVQSATVRTTSVAVVRAPATPRSGSSQRVTA